MTCETFETRLDELLDGRCTADRWREAEAHAAGCARCRRILDAVSGRADDMDSDGHEALSRAVVERTSGGSCTTARERLCDFVDGELEPFDRDLVGSHLAKCASCASLAAALAEATALVPSFAALAPPAGLAQRVLAATTRRPAVPTFGDRVSAWLAHVAERPRFSLEVAYVLTVLMLVVLGNPVDAFREASGRVQPRVSVVASAVSGPIAHARAAGEETLSRVERALRPKTESAGALAEARVRVWQWWLVQVDAPIRAILSNVSAWIGSGVDAIRRLAAANGRPAADWKPVAESPGEPAARPMR